MKNYNVNKDGFHGDFGGAFIPEMLFPNINELQRNYIKISESKEFKNEFNQLLNDYVGRPTPLYYAKRLSKKYKQKFILRERIFAIQVHTKLIIQLVKYFWQKNLAKKE